MDIAANLLKMIRDVSGAPDAKQALMHLVHPLLRSLNMRQGSFCEIRDGAVVPLFSIDNTKRILDPKKDCVWISRTKIEEAMDTMEPIVYVSGGSDEKITSVPDSIHRYNIRHLVVLPVGHDPAQALYLASQETTDVELSQELVANLKIACQAAALALQQHRHFNLLREHNHGLMEKLRHNHRAFLYSSTSMAAVVEQIGRLAPFNISVLLQGESGSGKEEIAHQVHLQSGRPGRFVAINCANLSETLLESDLFGHVKGAFTGAQQAKNGLFTEANEGTFFLDEVGELPLNLQAKLLRVLQERVVRPIGAVKDIPINVRFISASHKNLWELVQEKKFREDLYYRLQEFTLKVPALRERKEDIILLTTHFLREFSAEFSLPKRKLGLDAEQALLAHPWPGNIRELKNVCRTAVILSANSELSAKDFRFTSHSESATSKTESAPHSQEDSNVVALHNDGEPEIIITTRLPKGKSQSLRELTEDFERQIINEMLGDKGATQGLVAKQLGISVRTLQRSLQ